VGRHILVVDDAADLRAIVARALRERGHEVVELEDGLAGLEAVRNTAVPFELVITNSRQPNRGGPQLVDRLRELDPSLPIIHISGSHRMQGNHLTTDAPNLYQPFSIWALVEEAEKLMQGAVSQEWDWKEHRERHSGDR
jgi:DNA-binding NtrC family response regulator